ncbi:MAG: M15 family metallopeptidase [Vitreoscilla sp.]
MASRDIKDLDSRLQPLAIRFVADCKAAGIDVILTCTWRSNQEQDTLYAQGRTAPGHVVTNARAGQSKHNPTQDGHPCSQAFDMAPVVNGKIDWSPSNPAWARCGAIGKELGLEWAGDWKSFREFPHFQLKAV